MFYMCIIRYVINHKRLSRISKYLIKCWDEYETYTWFVSLINIALCKCGLTQSLNAHILMHIGANIKYHALVWLFARFC